MNERPTRRGGFAARPANAEDWIRTTDTPAVDGAIATDTTPFSARLTIDVTPDLRGRIKIAAFGRGQTAAAMLRELLERSFPPVPGDPS